MQIKRHANTEELDDGALQSLVFGDDWQGKTGMDCCIDGRPGDGAIEDRLSNKYAASDGDRVRCCPQIEVSGEEVCEVAPLVQLMQKFMIPRPRRLQRCE